MRALFSSSRTALSAGLSAALLCSFALVSSPAQAGGIGIVGGGGMGANPVYAYDSDGEQYKLNQLRPMTNLGVQLVLGDRDDRFVGVARLYWQAELPQTSEGLAENAADQGAEGEVTFAYNQNYHHVGIGMAGIQWGIWGDRTGGLSVNALSMIGSGFMTADATEFLVVELGPGVQYAMTKRVQFNAELLYQARYRKGFKQGAYATMGVRYLFD